MYILYIDIGVGEALREQPEDDKTDEGNGAKCLAIQSRRMNSMYVFNRCSMMID